MLNVKTSSIMLQIRGPSCNDKWFFRSDYIISENSESSQADIFDGEMTMSLWRHLMETFPALQVLCAGNSLVTGEFPARPVTLSFDVFFDLCLNKRLSKQPWGWWYETPSHSLWRHCNENYDLDGISSVMPQSNVKSNRNVILVTYAGVNDVVIIGSGNLFLPAWHLATI